MERRDFLKNTGIGIAGAGLLTQASPLAANSSEDEFKIKLYRKLGRTGFKASDIASGGNPPPAVLRALLEAGVNYIDTAESYGGGQSERTVGQVIKGFDRKSLFITTKLHPSRGFTKEQILSRVRKCLDRMQTEYIDCLMIHNCPDSKSLKSEDFHAAVKQLKNEGRLRFIGVSNHGLRGGEAENMEQVLMSAVADGRFDVMLLIYNFVVKDMGERILKAAAQKDIGCTLMKTKPLDRYLIAKKQMEEQLKKSGEKMSEGAKQRLDVFKQAADQAEAFGKKHNLKNPREIRNAAVKFVLSNPLVTNAVIHFRSFDDVDPYLELSGKALTPGDKKKLALYREGFNSFYCRHACGLCEAHCPHGVPVNTIMRYNHYFDSQGLEKHAMEKYAALAAANAGKCADCDGHCQAACPYNVHIHAMMNLAHNNLAIV